MNTVRLNKLKKINANINRKNGRINSFYVDPRSKKVAAVNIKLPDEEVIMDFSVLRGIEDKKAIKGSASALRLDLVELHSMTVLSSQGKVIGKLSDIDMDSQSGDIKYIYVESYNDSGELTIASDDISTFGQTILIVNEAPSLDTNRKELQAHKELAPPKKNIIRAKVSRQSEKKSDDRQADELVKRQLKYLIGSKASKDIRMADGALIVKEGDIIDETIIKKAVKAGKTMELLSHE